ncbi:MAG TPA: sigma-70 family RNA polymerase sigma factor [Solirubrobacterales bacterium]|nr:sigma-70 family RNA polymerase sigma factor [Solirubrobacterales bacterium]
MRAVEEREGVPRSRGHGHSPTSVGAPADNGWSGGAKQIAAAVVRHLRASFGGSLNEQDYEDLAQEALLAIHRREVAGERIRDPRAFAKRVAWRDARDLVQNRCVSPSDPQGHLLNSVEDRGGDPEARMLARAELARAIEAAERLTPEQQVVYRSRFVEQLEPRESCRILGLSRQTYYFRLRSAVSAVHEALEAERFASIERELLSAYIAGTGSAGERRRARRLLAADPHAVALARQLRDLHHGAAAALPLPAVDRIPDPSILDRVAGAIAGARDRLIAPGSDHGAEQIATQLSASGAARAGGAGAGGVMAHLGLAGSAGKIIASCLATGAAATACVAAGVLPAPALRGHAEAERKTPSAREASADILPAPAPPSPPSQIGTETPLEPPQGEPPPAEEPPPEPVEPVAPTAPVGEQEFGVASAATSTSSGSAGGSSSDGGGESAAAREFGQP